MYADQLESPLIEYHVFQQFFRHLLALLSCQTVLKARPQLFLDVLLIQLEAALVFIQDRRHRGAKAQLSARVSPAAPSGRRGRRPGPHGNAASGQREPRHLPNPKALALTPQP
jgi:hypothetical protein